MHGASTATTATSWRARPSPIPSSICRCCLPRCWLTITCVSEMRLILPALLLLSALAGCSDKPGSEGGQMSLTPASKTFQNSDVTGLGYARDFALNDQDGKPRTLADFKGKAVVVFFGYTH